MRRCPGVKLNASGSLYFVPHPNLLDVWDVQHGTVRLRFSLTETLSNVSAPLALDPRGRFIYLITNKGLTIIDLGQALLSIGSITPEAANSGMQVTVRAVVSMFPRPQRLLANQPPFLSWTKTQSHSSA